MDEVRIRNAAPSEVDLLIEFWSRAGQNAARPLDRADAVERMIVHDPQAVIVADLNGRIVGTIIAGWDGWRANLYRLAVDPDLRGNGLGRRLLTAAEDRLRDLGAERYCAMVLNDNELGTSLWTSSHYVQQDQWRRWVKPAHDGRTEEGDANQTNPPARRAVRVGRDRNAKRPRN